MMNIDTVGCLRGISAAFLALEHFTITDPGLRILSYMIHCDFFAHSRYISTICEIDPMKLVLCVLIE